MLTDCGCDEIRTVRSAARALAIAATFQPAIAFLGIPTADGLEGNLATMLQKNAREKTIRLIGVTDRAVPPGREEARASGVERFISKPVTQVELDKALRKSPVA
jgi:CheY-like chemotaxis protein